MAFEKVKEIIKDSPAFTKLTDLAAGRLGGKVLYATDDFLPKRKISSNRAGVFSSPINIPTGANGWMVGRAAASVRPDTTGP